MACNTQMGITRLDLSIYQGDDFVRSVMVTNGSTPPQSVIAGYTAKAQVRAGPADTNPEVVVEITCTVQSPYINLSIPKETTLTMPGGDFVWDLQIISPATKVTTIMAGGVRVTPEVTR